MIAVLIACYNRKDMTLEIVKKFANFSESFDLYVVDGGSKDGTRHSLEILCKEYSNIELIFKDDSYWAESMRSAWQIAKSAANYDGYLLLNDDLQIEKKRIEEFLDEINSFVNTEIYVGQCMDDSLENITYGGLVRKNSKSKIHFRVAQSEETSVTFNANFVYISKDVVSKIGILSQKFRHSFADIDYGLRATLQGIQIRVISKPVGTTNYNVVWSESLSKVSIRNWRNIFFDPKGIPIKEWFFFCYTHGGLVWPINFLMRYLKVFVSYPKLRKK